jgi:hypothetical protein
LSAGLHNRDDSRAGTHTGKLNHFRTDTDVPSLCVVSAAPEVCIPLDLGRTLISAPAFAGDQLVAGSEGGVRASANFGLTYAAQLASDSRCEGSESLHAPEYAWSASQCLVPGRSEKFSP